MTTLIKTDGTEINPSLHDAILCLDPADDSNWVRTGAHKGKPKLQAVEKAYGKAGLTRQDIEAAVPRWDRQSATILAVNHARHSVGLPILWKLKDCRALTLKDLKDLRAITHKK